MAVRLQGGQTSKKFTRDGDGYGDFRVKYQVIGDTFDGPSNALLAPGLPRPGDPWIIDADIDLWAFCKLDCTVTERYEKEPVRFFDIEFKFSSKPDEQRCKKEPVQDPLLIPPQISGTTTKYNEEQTWDKFGNLLVNSAFEQIRGPQVEFDRNRSTVKIQMNVPSLQLELVNSFVNTVNGTPWWGFPPRCVKLSDFNWEVKYYAQCYVYYSWSFTFDINTQTFDRNILDEGSKVLNGHWDRGTGVWIVDPIAPGPPLVPADNTNPSHFRRFKDRLSENSRVILNGAGLPASVIIYPPWSSTVNYPQGKIVSYNGIAWKWLPAGVQLNKVPGTDPTIWQNMGSANSGIPGNRFVQFYNESNFALLGIPLIW